MARLFKGRKKKDQEGDEEDYSDDDFEQDERDLPELPPRTGGRGRPPIRKEEPVKVVEREITLGYVNDKLNHLIGITEETLTLLKSATD